MKELNYKKLHLDLWVENRKKGYRMLNTKVYNGKLYNYYDQKEVIDLIVEAEKLGYEEKDLLPYFEKEEKDGE